MALLFSLALSTPASAQEEFIDFESSQWVFEGAQVVQHLDRKALMGSAYLKDVDFQNGVIEVDIATNGRTSYPGLIFRRQSNENYESFYLRPHRSNLYPDALQYTPVFNGLAGWQLYHGDGFTAGGNIPRDRWFHIRMEIMGKQARVFIDEAEQPALIIDDLKHGLSRGTIGVMGPADKTSYFSNFRYTKDADLKFDPPPQVETPPGLLSSWQLSPVFKADQIDRELCPDKDELAQMEWQSVSCEPSGLVDIARHKKRLGRAPDCVLAKTTLYSEKEEVKKLLFGYTDEIHLFLNGKILFTGNSAYRLRDGSFLGIVGLYDAVYLPLKKGKNELLLMITEGFGGWGFICQDGRAVYLEEDVQKMWDTENTLKIPESVVYDPKRNVVFVSNYDGYNPSNNQGKQFLSKVSLDGTIEKLKWVEGLNNPTGLTRHEDKLYVVERNNLVEIDIESGNILNRYPAPQPGFMNDVAIDSSGNAYISDSRKHVIYRVANGKFEVWFEDSEIRNPNGLHVHHNKLIVGNNGDSSLKSIDLESKQVATICQLGAGIIDGIKTDSGGNYIVSHWEGKIYRITPSGQVTKLLDSTAPKINTADFDYVVEKNLLIIPTFTDNRVLAYKVKD